MRKVLAILGFLGWLAVPSLAFAYNPVGGECFNVTGAGDSSVNGLYQDTGAAYNSNFEYKTTGAILYDWFNAGHTPPDYWFISTGSPGSELPDGTSNPAYYQLTSSGITGGYANNGMTAPAPLVALTTCPGASTSTLSSYGLWGLVTTSTAALVTSAVPFWEIFIGSLMALFLFFLFGKSLVQAMRRLLR